ncbi:MAG: GNAT family N-acetyltransferase, partial [Alphaproteobacteria bacterium]|nr:GNAT family N-acetyltransferase [Alphaproteobacteria bacterium]
DNAVAEYAVEVRSDWKGRGLGYTLMQAIIGYGRDRGVGEIYGTILSENAPMIEMARELGFAISTDRDGGGVVTARLPMRRDTAA